MIYQIGICNQRGAKKAFIKEFKDNVHYNRWYMKQLERGNKIIHTSLAR